MYKQKYTQANISIGGGRVSVCRNKVEREREKQRGVSERRHSYVIVDAKSPVQLIHSGQRECCNILSFVYLLYSDSLLFVGFPLFRVSTLKLVYCLFYVYFLFCTFVFLFVQSIPTRFSTLNSTSNDVGVSYTKSKSNWMSYLKCLEEREL